MAKAEASVEELVGMIERGELRLPEMQRRYVWRSTRVRDLLDSLYRGYPSGAILLWETDEAVPSITMPEIGDHDGRIPHWIGSRGRFLRTSAIIRRTQGMCCSSSRRFSCAFASLHAASLATVAVLPTPCATHSNRGGQFADSGVRRGSPCVSKIALATHRNRPSSPRFGSPPHCAWIDRIMPSRVADQAHRLHCAKKSN